MPQPHVQVILADAALPNVLEAALRRARTTASFRPLSEALKNGLTPTADAVIVVAPDDLRPVADRLKVLLERLADQPRATLVLQNGPAVGQAGNEATGQRGNEAKTTGLAPARLAHPPTVPVSFARGAGAEELAIRLNVMLEMRPSLDSLHRGLLAQDRSRETAARGYQNQLRLASQLQRDFLPETSLRFGRLSFATVFRPADYVSGDLYDIQRLDEQHVGIALADATGHGIPAALLTVFIKRALRGKERVYDEATRQRGNEATGQRERLLRPDEVLARLNADILEANLSDGRFVAATYAVVNLQTLELTLARGGAPYPLLRRADGSLTALRPAGGVVGVLPEATFDVEIVQLRPGDALVLHSDGLEKMVVKAGNEATGQPGNEATRQRVHEAMQTRNMAHPATSAAIRVPPEEPLLRSSWGMTLESAGAAVALDELLVRCETLRRLGPPADDLTVVALQVDAG